MRSPISSRIVGAGIVGLVVFAATAGLSNIAKATPAISVTNTTANTLGPQQTFTLGYQFTLSQLACSTAGKTA